MLYPAFNLKEDPFLLKSTTGEDHLTLIPFVPTESYQIIANRVFYHFAQPSSSQISLYLYFVGNIGVGKSTAIFHLKKRLENDDFRVAYLGSNYKTEASIYREITQSYQRYAPELKKNWDNTRSIVVFDVPDSANRTNLSKMASVMQELMVKFKTSMIPVFNRDQFHRFQSLGTILGKFNPYFLDAFTINDTMNMIHKRLERARIKPHKDPLYPFSNDIVEKIHRIAQGNPRSILVMSSLLLEEGKEPIDDNILKKVSKEDYIAKILQQRYQDPYKINTLKQLVGIIENDFNGCAPSQTDLVKKVKEVLDWGRHTTRRKIKELQEAKILLVSRNEEEAWRMDHRLVTFVDY